MYKVIIIVDEVFILKGLKQIIDWSAFGCEICATATGAEEGLEKIKEHKPDIVITDVKMRAMSGLEMIEAARDIIPFSKFIIMTGYRDFEYAHTAISLGVSEYILKPTDIKEIKAAIEKTVAELDKIKKAERNEIENGKNATAYRQMFEERVLSDILMYKEINYAYIKEQFGNNGICFDEFFVASICFDTKSNPLDTEDIKNVFISVSKLKSEIYAVKSEKRDELFIITAFEEGEKCDKETLRLRLEEARFRLSGRTCAGVCMGISDMGNGVDELLEKKQESCIAMEEGLCLGKNNVIFYSDIRSVTKKVVYNNVYQQNICEALIAGSEDKTARAVAEASEFLRDKETDYAKRFCYDTVKMMNAYYYNIHPNKEAEETADKNVKRMIFDCGSYDELINCISVFAKETTKKFFNYNLGNIEGLAAKIKEYIGANYTKDISRDDIARFVNISPSYVSVVFKKIEGKSVMGYVTELRINEAKRLLSEKKYSCQEVSAMVGYNEYSYFANVFKKHVGVTPSVYQSGMDN